MKSDPLEWFWSVYSKIHQLLFFFPEICPEHPRDPKENLATFIH